MKKNAFTLVEMIATIALLGMLATITITVSVRKINETKEKARDTMKESIELAAKKYVNENEVIEFTNYDNVYISLQTLVEKEYFTENLVDPITKKNIPLTNEIYITREENGEIKSNYNINQRKETKLTLIGSYNEYVEVGKEYIEHGVIAISPNKEDVSTNVIITGNVDTTTTNTYKITYELDNVKITRNVIVYGKNLSSEETLKASTYIERLYKTNNYQNDELSNPKVTYEGKEYDTGIRYTGVNPNNYVYFNCKDTDSNNVNYGETDYDYASSCEIWRIIGVFNTKSSETDTSGTPRIKIVRDAFSTNMSWDSSSSGTNAGETVVNKGNGVNQWGEVKDSNGNIIYEGSDLMRMLNRYYVGEENTCTYCNNSNQGECSNNCSRTVTPLSSTTLNMVEDAVWHTGTPTYNGTLALSTMYAGERKTQSGKICTSGDYCNDSVTRTTEWIGKVGLIYPSDYAYASIDEGCVSDIVGIDSTCNVNNWLHPSSGGYLTMSPLADSSRANRVWCVASSHRMNNNSVYTAYGVRPAIYLKSSVKIKSGNGSPYSPYILSK